MNAEGFPVACQLSSAELREREASIIAEFKSGVIRVEEVVHGFRFQLAGEEKWIGVVAKLITAERECCPFLQFDLLTQANHGAVRLTITGPEGTKEFLRGIFI